MAADGSGFVDPERERSGVWGWLGEVMTALLADEYEDVGPNGDFIVGTLK